MNIYTKTLICLAAIAVLAAPSCAQPTSFVIDGWIFNEGGTTGCNNPAVQMTNATGESWDAENASTSNYYRFALTGSDVSDGDTLQFDAAGCSQSNTTSHTVSQAEIDAGGFEFNITLGPRPGDVNDDGHLTTADAAIVLKMAVCGEYSEVADVSGDRAVTSLDALMILQEVGTAS